RGARGPAAAGTPISPAVQVSVEDAFGTLVATSGTSIDVALGANPAGGLLSGQTHSTTVGGVATFPDLSLDKPSSGYTLVASAANLPAATSAPFLIAPAGGPAARIGRTTGHQQPAPARPGLPIAYAIQGTDAYGVRIAGATVTWTIGAGGGSVTTGQGVTDSGGLASTQRTLGAHAGAQTVVATVQGLADSAATFVASAMPNGTISGTITLRSGVPRPPASPRTSGPPPKSTSRAAPPYTPA